MSDGVEKEVNCLDATLAGEAAATVCNRRDINNGIEVKTCSLESAEGLFTSWANTLHFHRHRLDTKGRDLGDGVFCRNLGGVRSRLAGSFESG